MKKLQPPAGLWTARLTGLVAGTLVLLFLGETTRQANLAERHGVRTDYVSLVKSWLDSSRVRRAELLINRGNQFTIDSNENPWRIKPVSLSRERVIYNLSTKEGFLELAWMSLTLVGLIYASFCTVTYVVMRKWNVLRALAGTRVKIEIAGTVQIAAHRGVIYIASGRLNQPSSYRNQIYTYKWLPVKITVSHVL